MPPIHGRPSSSPATNTVADPPGSQTPKASYTSPLPGHDDRTPTTRVAVNMFDIDRVDPLTRQIILGGRLNLDHAVLAGDQRRSSPNDVGLEFTCDLVTAATMIHALRNMDAKHGRSATRAYKCDDPKSPSERWHRLHADVPTIVIIDNRCTLNPEVFPPPPVPTTDMDFEPKDVIFGDDD